MQDFPTPGAPVIAILSHDSEFEESPILPSSRILAVREGNRPGGSDGKSIGISNRGKNTGTQSLNDERQIEDEKQE